MNKQQRPLRPVRSYMCRSGRMTDSQQRAFQLLLDQYGLTLANGMLDFDAIFQRNAPRVLEIGFGMGQSLLQQAQQKPAWDFIGIEVHRPGIGALLAAVKTQQLTNLRVFHADAIEVLECCIPDASLDVVQLFFPDPWPKRRHHKRRLVQLDFVERIRAKLKIGGLFCLATDWQNYANHMLQVLSAAPGFNNSAGDQQFAPRYTERPLTKFELRGHRLGYKVWDLVFVNRE